MSDVRGVKLGVLLVAVLATLALAGCSSDPEPAPGARTVTVTVSGAPFSGGATPGWISYTCMDGAAVKSCRSQLTTDRVFAEPVTVPVGTPVSVTVTGGLGGNSCSITDSAGHAVREDFKTGVCMWVAE